VSSFLQDIAQLLKTQHQSLADVAVVLPGKRTSIFLKKHLKALEKGAHWHPEFLTMSEVLAKQTPFQAIQQLDLLVEAFLSFKEVCKSEESFDSFMSWGPVMLADFNEIDHQLADPDAVFTDLRKIKYVEAWSFNAEELSLTQEEFLYFWNQLPKVYHHLKNKLQQKGSTYGGAIARWQCEQALPLDHGFEHLYVVGLNAMTQAEAATVRQWLRLGTATVLFDGDEWYVNDPQIEAGTFIRQATQVLGKLPIANHFCSKGKHLQIVAASSAVAQCKWVMNVLQEMSEDDIENTAIVLPDESMLPAVIESIPDQVKSANVSMGIALRSTPLSGLIAAFFRMMEGSSGSVRFSDLLDLLRHPYIKSISSKTALLNTLENDIVKENLTFIDLNTPQKRNWNTELQQWLTPWLKAAKSKRPEDIIEGLYHLVESIDGGKEQKEEEKPNDAQLNQRVMKQVMKQFANVLRKVERFQNKHQVLESPYAFRQILMKMLNKEQLDLLGEPLSGLQIMGLLETRALDFKNVFILACNEGILPQRHFSDSFLPQDVRAQYHLPSPSDREAIFAAYFYSLIQRCERAFLLYAEGEQSMEKAGEKSRYLQQLEYHFKAHPKIKLSQTNFSIPSGKLPALPSGMWSNDWVKNRVKVLLDGGLSPSAINTWIQCKQDFFFKYIMGLNEQEDVEETMESSTFGTIVHEVMEEVLKPFINKIITAEDIDQIEVGLVNKVEEVITKNYKGNLTKQGENYLAKKVVEQYLRALLKVERQNIPATLQSLENKLNMSISTDIPFNIRGTVDRIDQKDGITRVIDYKTGRVEPRELNIASIEALEDPKHSKALQVLLYLLMAKENGIISGRSVEGGIISARNISNGFMKVTVNKDDFDESTEQELRAWLLKLRDELLSDQEIVHNPDAEYCEYCVSLKP